MTTEWTEESVYHLLPLPVKRPVKPPRYISRFRPSVKREMQARKKEACKTIGPPALQVPSPTDFLRKHSKEPLLPKRKRPRGSKKLQELRVPPRTERPIMGVRCEKNFIGRNAAEAIVSVATKPLRACVDMRCGDKFLIDNSGLVKKYLKKKDFGATPRYLAKQNNDAKRAKEESNALIQKALRQKAPKQISKEEREMVLQGLRKNWEELSQKFQSLSVVIDTIPQKLHKEKLETEMLQLEHDIKILEKHNFIYVASD